MAATNSKYVLAIFLGLVVGSLGTGAVVKYAVIAKFNAQLDHDQKEIANYAQLNESNQEIIRNLQGQLQESRSQTQIVTDEFGHTVPLDVWFKHAGGHVMNEAQCRAWAAVSK
jgi:hypothetical protein